MDDLNDVLEPVLLDQRPGVLRHLRVLHRVHLSYDMDGNTRQSHHADGAPKNNVAGETGVIPTANYVTDALAMRGGDGDVNPVHANTSSLG